MPSRPHALAKDEDEMVICELVLVELYLLLRNEKIIYKKLSPQVICTLINKFRTHPTWRLIENAPVMTEVWKQTATQQFARRRIFDIRLAFTLQHHGVKQFATANTKDFKGLGFDKVWNPLK